MSSSVAAHGPLSPPSDEVSDQCNLQCGIGDLEQFVSLLDSEGNVTFNAAANADNDSVSNDGASSTVSKDSSDDAVDNITHILSALRDKMSRNKAQLGSLELSRDHFLYERNKELKAKVTRS